MQNVSKHVVQRNGRTIFSIQSQSIIQQKLDPPGTKINKVGPCYVVISEAPPYMHVKNTTDCRIFATHDCPDLYMEHYRVRGQYSYYVCYSGFCYTSWDSTIMPSSCCKDSAISCRNPVGATIHTGSSGVKRRIRLSVVLQKALHV